MRTRCLLCATAVIVLSACGGGANKTDVGIGPAPNPSEIASEPVRRALAPAGMYDTDGCLALEDEIETLMPTPPSTTPLPHEDEGLPCIGNESATIEGADYGSYAGYLGSHYTTEDLGGSFVVLNETISMSDTASGLRVQALIRNESAHWADDIDVSVTATTATGTTTHVIAPLVQPLRPGEPAPFVTTFSGIAVADLTDLEISATGTNVDIETGDLAERDFAVRPVLEVPHEPSRTPLNLPSVGYSETSQGPFPYLRLVEFQYFGTQSSAEEVRVWVAFLDDLGSLAHVEISPLDAWSDEQVVTSVDTVDRPIVLFSETDAAHSQTLAEGRLLVWVAAAVA